MNVDLDMTSDRSGVTDAGRVLPIGSRVRYIAHVPGGMVRVRLEDDTEAVVHPHCFAVLR